MKVQVKLFATMKEFLPGQGDYSSCQVELNQGATAADVLRKLGIPEEIPKIILINGVVVKPDHRLAEGDAVSIFPPIAGGLSATIGVLRRGSIY